MYKIENLANIHQYHNKVSREIDDADWMGDTERSTFLESELEVVKEMIAKGDLYYPLF